MRGEAWMRPSPTASGRNQPSWHLGLGLPVPRTVRQHISVVLSPWFEKSNTEHKEQRGPEAASRVRRGEGSSLPLCSSNSPVATCTAL